MSFYLIETLLGVRPSLAATWRMVSLRWSNRPKGSRLYRLIAISNSGSVQRLGMGEVCQAGAELGMGKPELLVVGRG